MMSEIQKADLGIAYSNTGDLFADARTIIDGAQSAARAAVNVALVQRNWLLGRRIAEEVLGNEDVAEYGAAAIVSLAKGLTQEYGRGFSKTNLYQFLSFYRQFPEILHSVRGKSPLLSWTHYRELIRVHDSEARAWYEREAANQNWSARTLSRNISSQYYYRLLASQARGPVEEEMLQLTAPFQKEAYRKLEFVKNPVIAEFLGFEPDACVRESELESAILANLQKFLMELGKGYAFVGRQEHVRGYDGDYFIDLVFYNYILKCFVLIDLKTEKITHQDVGQMDMYVRMYDEMKREEGDNPTLGIVLCAETSEDIAHYSILKGNEQLFAAKYELYLPTEEQLRAEIEAQRTMFLLQQEKDAGEGGAQ